jgi:hypothetical protein
LSSFKVTDGESRYPWIVGSAEGLEIQSCQVCADRAFDAEGNKIPYQPAQLTNYSEDLGWLEGAWCWDWDGRPGMSRYQRKEGNTFMWGTQQHTIDVNGKRMRSTATDNSFMEREIIDRDTLRLVKHGLRRHEQEVSVIMWRCE